MKKNVKTILCDIGGTYTRISHVNHELKISCIDVHETKDCSEFESFYHNYIEKNQLNDNYIENVFLSVAAPVRGDVISITNNNLIINRLSIYKNLEIKNLIILNDYEAVAWSVKDFSFCDLQKIGRGDEIKESTSVVLGCGTGLGISVHIPNDEMPTILATEGGHVTIQMHASIEEYEVFDYLRKMTTHVAAEDLLSGRGILRLYQAFVSVRGKPYDQITPEIVTERAMSGECPECQRAFDMFWGVLGSFAGNLALMFDARGGVYLGGGIVRRFPQALEGSVFRDRFEAKGRFSGYMSGIPTYRIAIPNTELLGLAAYARKHSIPLY